MMHQAMVSMQSERRASLWVLCAALLPELAALGDVLARQPQWAEDLRAVRARHLRILQVSHVLVGAS